MIQAFERLSGSRDHAFERRLSQFSVNANVEAALNLRRSHSNLQRSRFASGKGWDHWLQDSGIEIGHRFQAGQYPQSPSIMNSFGTLRKGRQSGS